MSYYVIGELIKKLRKQQRITQTELSRDITDKANLSRIENGKQLPSKHILDRLLQRLGFNSRNLYYHFSEEEYVVYRKRYLLQVLIDQRKNDEAEEMLEELASLSEFEQIIDRQFVLCSKASIMINQGKEVEEIRKVIYEALKITISEFSETEIHEYLFTNDDYKLVNMLAITYSEEGNMEKAVEILTALKISIELAKLEDDEKTKILPLILYNLTKYLGLLERYEEAIKLCDYACDICVKYGNMRLLPMIIFNKACDLLEIGDTQMCKRLLYQAYCGCDMMGKYSIRDQIKSYAKEKFGIAIDAE